MRKAAAFLLLLAPSLAFAQPSRPSADTQEQASGDCARARKLGKTCVLTIGPEEIEGGAVRPDGLDITARDRVKFNSLVKVRTSFIPEILKSASDLD